MGLEIDELTRALAAGQEWAYAALYDRYGPALFRVAARLLGDASDAEDAVQNLFESLVRYRDRLSGVRDLPAYLFASLRRSAMGIARKRPVLVRAPGFLLNVPADDLPQDSAAADEVRAAVRTLPPDQREVLWLKVDGELTFEQIGDVLGISPNTVASRYRYAIEKLRQRVGKRHE